MKKKLNQQGFTLVELLAVVVILIIIMLIALPNFSSSIDRNNEKNTKNIENAIKSVGASYISNNMDNIDVDLNNFCYFPIQSLISADYISEDDIKNYANGCIIFDQASNEFFVTKDEYTNQCQISDKSSSKLCLDLNNLSSIQLKVNILSGKNYSKSKKAIVQIIDSDSNGLTDSPIQLYYNWSTSEVSCSSMSEFITLTPKNGDKIVSGEINISSKTGKGKLYVCNKDAPIKDNTGNLLVQNTLKSANMYLDNTKPKIEDAYVASNLYPFLNITSSNQVTIEDNKLITSGTDPYIVFSKLSISKVTKAIITLKSGAVSDFDMQVFYASDSNQFTEKNSVKKSVSTGSRIIEVDLPTGDYTEIRFDFGNQSGVSFDIEGIDLVADEVSNVKYIYARLIDSDSLLNSYAVTTSDATPSDWTNIDSVSNFNFRYKLDNIGTYYIWAKDTAGNISDKLEISTFVSIEKPTNNICLPTTYNGNSQILTNVSGTGYALSGNSGIDAGNYKIVAKLKDNYIWSDGTRDDLTITCNIGKKKVTVTANSQTIDYGDNISEGVSYVSISGLVSGHVLSNITLTTSTSNVTTTGTISPSGAIIKSNSVDVTSNYNISYKTGTLTINKVDATCPTVTGYSDVYDGNSHTVTVSGGSGGTVQYRTSTTGTWTTTKPTRTNVGTTTVYMQVAGDSNHNTKDCGSKSIVISERGITITANAQTVNYGTAITTGTDQVTTSGLVSGHVLTEITLTQSTTNATTSGTITPSGAKIQVTNTSGADVTSNYSITYNTGTLTINKVAAVLTCSNKTYNGSEQTACSCSGGTVSGTYKATNYSSTAYTASCTPDSNHTAPANKTWTMSRKAVTVTAKAQTVNYGTAITTGTDQVTTSGLVSGHVLTAITLTQSTSNVTTNGTITPSDAIIKSNSVDVTSNYNISYKTGNLTINSVDTRTNFNLKIRDWQVVSNSSNWVTTNKINKDYDLDGSTYLIVCNSSSCTDVSTCTESNIEDCDAGSSGWIGSFSQIYLEAPESSTVYAWYRNDDSQFLQNSWTSISDVTTSFSYRFTNDKYNVMWIRVDYNGETTVFKIFLKLDYTAPSATLPTVSNSNWYNFNPNYTTANRITYVDNESGLDYSVSAFIEKKDSCSYNEDTNTSNDSSCTIENDCCLENSPLNHNGTNSGYRNTNCTIESSCISSYNNLWSCITDMVGNKTCVYKNSPSASQSYGGVYYLNTH